MAARHVAKITLFRKSQRFVANGAKQISFVTSFEATHRPTILAVIFQTVQEN